MKNKTYNILAIESSCDETSAAVVEVTKGYDKNVQPLVTESNLFAKPKVTILSNIVSSQVELHAKYGGVYPELASREHVRNILPVIKKALSYRAISHKDFEKLTAYDLLLKADIDYIAVTTGPGLIGSLLIGVNTAKTLAYTLNKPIYSINHLEGHIYANFVGREVTEGYERVTGSYRELQEVTKSYNISNATNSNQSQPLVTDSNQIIFPLIALIVSGGHTSIVYMKNHLDYKIIGETLDDAAGEAFDKAATMLKLDYPGGPVISALAEKVTKSYNISDETNGNQSQPLVTDSNHIRFPRPMIDSNNFNFSFSGLKTSVLYTIKKLPKPLSKKLKSLICKEFQDAVLETLVTKTIKAAKTYQAKSILLCGGVSANNELRKRLQAASYKLPANFFVPEKSLCTDNAAMIGIAAAYKIALSKKPTPWYNINADSNKKLQ
jgi:N6-L-threonylcarbamoyladenine synthase